MPYYRALIRFDPVRSNNAVMLGNTPLWFDSFVVDERGRTSEILPVAEVPAEVVEAVSAPRKSFTGLDFSAPVLMGIVNVTPDSFSDGGKFVSANAGATHAENLFEDGVHILDIGGESTRPGAQEVPVEEEIERVLPVIRGIRDKGIDAPISIDTRKSQVADAALGAGADIINDVSAFNFDPKMSDVAFHSDAPVCLMHAQGAPENMQDDPKYSDVVFDVYDALSEKVTAAVAAGCDRSKIIVDPGIGFGKTLDHNLALLRSIALFHSLGCPVLVGASRKRFIGTLTNESEAEARMPGSVAVALHSLSQGVQIIRAHDIKAHKQAVAMANALWSVT